MACNREISKQLENSDLSLSQNIKRRYLQNHQYYLLYKNEK